LDKIEKNKAVCQVLTPNIEIIKKNYPSVLNIKGCSDFIDKTGLEHNFLSKFLASPPNERKFCWHP
jgi:hypothetical protein